MQDIKKKKIVMPATELRGNDQQVARNFDLEMRLVHTINNGKPPTSFLEEED